VYVGDTKRRSGSVGTARHFCPKHQRISESAVSHPDDCRRCQIQSLFSCFVMSGKFLTKTQSILNVENIKFIG
jgi:hypothetical protein